MAAELIPKLEFEQYCFYKKFKAQFKTVPLTWFSTSIAISMNMSCSSRMEFSNLIISACLASISASVCFACCVSIIICNHTTLQYCYISHTFTLPYYKNYKHNWSCSSTDDRNIHLFLEKCRENTLTKCL